MAMAFATMRIHALVWKTHAGCATALEVYDCGCFDIPEGDCDCIGNQLDALFTCGGDCDADADGDNVCDDEDPCVGVYDECGICNGPGAVYACGCTSIPEGDCDCNGNVLDALGECGGDCELDLDSDGLCDDEDPCIGAYDGAACAMDLARFMLAGAAMSPKKIVTVRAINWMRSACAEVLAKPMTMRMGCVTQTSLWAAPCLPPATTTLRPKRTTAHVVLLSRLHRLHDLQL